MEPFKSGLLELLGTAVAVLAKLSTDYLLLTTQINNILRDSEVNSAQLHSAQRHLAQ
jgi:hypothetical protein